MPAKKNLSSSISYLPLNIQSRVELWLTYRKLKPCSLLLTRKPKDRKVINWLNEAGLSFYKDRKDTSQIFVSTNKNLAKKLADIWQDESSEAEYQKGILLGYPTQAVKAFSVYARDPNRKKYLTSILETDFPKAQINYFPYLSYIVRRDKISEDSKKAQQWSECIRKEIPKLACWYEKAIINSLSSRKIDVTG